MLFNVSSKKTLIFAQQTKAMKHIIILLFIILFAIPSFSQYEVKGQSTSQLAAMYYRDKQYDKAKELYLELYSTNNISHYFQYYINCLIFLKEYDDAIKVLKKQIRRRSNPIDKITLGYVYQEMGDINKSEETYNDVIENLSGNIGTITNVGLSFYNRREFEYAEKTYFRGREIVPGEKFHSNLALIYAYMRNYDRMMEEYLALLKEDENQVSRIKSRINSLLRYDFDNSLRETVKREIIKSIQVSPNTIAFNRLLIWMFVIENNYEQALNNSIALDRRTKMEDSNILEFAIGASQYNLFDVALTGLNYLKSKKPLSVNINKVKQEIVNVEYKRFVRKPKPSQTDNDNIIAIFENTLNELGYSDETIILIKSYAHLLSFHMGNTEKAYKVLENAMQIKTLTNNQRTNIRIELADTYVYDNNLWEAALLYTQIIEANKGNEFANEVKLKKAKLSYYLGDVQWARAQLDVLKASTSKLIANDAMELSLLISENYDLDTTEVPIQQFARADLLVFQNNIPAALITYDSISNAYPNHSLSDKILMRKAGISEIKYDYKNTAQIYEKVVSDYAYSTSADDALYKLAVLNEEHLNNIEKAQELYEKILINYPGSIFVVDARARFRALRGDNQTLEEITPYESQEFIKP